MRIFMHDQKRDPESSACRFSSDALETTFDHWRQTCCHLSETSRETPRNPSNHSSVCFTSRVIWAGCCLLGCRQCDVRASCGAFLVPAGNGWGKRDASPFRQIPKPLMFNRVRYLIFAFVEFDSEPDPECGSLDCARFAAIDGSI